MFRKFITLIRGFPGGSDGIESPCNSGDLSLIPGSGRSPGEGSGDPFQYSCLENPVDGGYSPWGCKESHMTELVSTVQQHESAILIHIPLSFAFPSHSGHHSALNRVPCAMQ